MPTYQYACTACDHQLEMVQSFTDAALTVCPACAGRLRKLYSGVGIVFKGSGFYRTDSRGSTGSTDSGGSGGDSTPAAAPAKSGSADKPAEKSTTASTDKAPAAAAS